jgi:hypothetical protein
MARDEADFLSVARGRYEATRWRFAFVGALGVLVLPLGSHLLGASWLATTLLGATLALGQLLSQWRGGVLAYASMSGLKAGLVPLALAHGAKLWGHVCTPTGCTSLCLPACTAGGVVGGLLVEWWARSTPRPIVARGVGAAMCVLTGALGCSCVGHAGVLGMVLGLAASMALGAVVTRPAPHD